MLSYDRALWALRSWLDSWPGIGHVAVGMAHQGYDLQLTRYDEKGWRATFYTTGMEHSPTSATAPCLTLASSPTSMPSTPSTAGAVSWTLASMGRPSGSPRLRGQHGPSSRRGRTMPAAVERDAHRN
jgi:hypothetical protein